VDFFFPAHLRRHVSAVLRSYRPVKLNDVKEQRISIKFCFKLGNTVVKKYKTFKAAFVVLGQTQTYEWFQGRAAIQ
jgi:hypothetical protein